MLMYEIMSRFASRRIYLRAQAQELVFKFMFGIVKWLQPNFVQKYYASGETCNTFYPRDAMLARVIEIATCLSVRLSVCLSVRHAPVLCQNEES